MYQASIAVPESAFVARSVSPRLLLALLLLWLGGDMLLAWRFIGFTAWWSYALGTVLLAAFVAGAVQVVPRQPGPSVTTLGICFAVALVLYLLGGEGRLFYANSDWMVRDGVLHDMATHSWPFAYLARGLPEILRAPVGMFLLPALAMGAWGQRVGDVVLLVQNTALLTLVLGLCASLFATSRRRAVALAVFVLFSGLDTVVPLLMYGIHGAPIPDHLEWWAPTLQYSSHVTQAFWVPQHALAGWICAAGFMLWHDKRLPLGVFLALVPLTTLWSPLAAIGALPFAALAGIIALWRRSVTVPDVVLPAAASLLAMPTLLYLQTATSSVGGRPASLDIWTYIVFELLEVAPYLLILLTARCVPRFGWPALAVVAAGLLLMPIFKVGISADFMMRASVPSLAILAVMIAQALTTEPRGGRRALLLAILATGSVTGLHEINRALRWPASPPPHCTFYGAWGPGPAADKSTYLAPVAQLPAIIRPARVSLIPAGDPVRCWARPWPLPTGR